MEAKRGAQLDDFVTLSYSMTLDGAPLSDESAEDMEITLGEQDAWEAFDEEIVGLKVGESKSFDFVYPERNATESLAGKNVRVCATVSKIVVWTKAALDAGFARNNGIEDGDLDALRARARKHLEEEGARLAWRQTKENVLDALLEAHTFVLPESLLQEKIRQRVDKAREDTARFLQQVVRRKPTREDLFSLSQEPYAEEVQRQMRLSLILKKIGALGNIPASARQSSFEALKHEDHLIEWVTGQSQGGGCAQ